MNYYFICIFFLILLNHRNFNAFPSVNAAVIEDDALVALAKGPKHFANFCAIYGLTIDEKNQFLSEKYEAHLGLLYYLRKDWYEMHSTEENILYEKQWEMSRKFAFILYEYLFREYVAEYVKAVDPAMAEQIPAVMKPITAFQYIEMGYSISITFCEAISDWANIRISVLNGLVDDSIWRNYEKTLIQNEQSLIENYEINFNRWYEPEYLFDMQKLNLRSSANAKFNNSFAPLRRLFDHNMKKMSTEAMAKLVPMRRFDIRRQNVFIKPFYGIDKAIDDNLFLSFLKEEKRSNFEKICSKLRAENLPKVNALKSNFIIRNAQTKLPDPMKRLIQEYVTYFAIFYLMREKWQCAKVERYQNECSKFRKYFNFLYEYFFRKYNEASHCGLTPQFDTVRPNFKFGHNGSIECLLAVLDRLGTIAAFFFDPTYAKEYGNKLDALFKQWPEPLLINETEVSGGKTLGQKIIGSVLQRGKSPTKTGKEKVNEESSSAAEQEAFVMDRANFENLIKQNFETVKALMEQNSAYQVNRIYEWLYSTTTNRQQEMPKSQTETAIPLDDDYVLVPKSQNETAIQLDDDYVLVPKSQTETAIPLDDDYVLVPKSQNETARLLDDDDMLIAFVTKDYANFEQYCMEMKKQDMLMHVGLLSKRKGKSKYDIRETVRYLSQQYEAYLGAMYLLRRKWKCEKIDNSLTRKECETFQSYLEVLYECLFIKHLEANKPSLAQQFAVIERPKFQIGTKKNATIIDVLDILCSIWAFFFDYDYGKKHGKSLEALFKLSMKPIFIDNQPIGEKIVNFFQKIKKYNMPSDDSAMAESSSNEAIGHEELLNETLIEKGKKREENTAKIELTRKAFDNLLESMTETAKNMQSDEGFGKNRQVLRWLFQ